MAAVSQDLELKKEEKKSGGWCRRKVTYTEAYALERMVVSTNQPQKGSFFEFYLYRREWR